MHCLLKPDVIAPQKAAQRAQWHVSYMSQTSLSALLNPRAVPPLLIRSTQKPTVRISPHILWRQSAAFATIFPLRCNAVLAALTTTPTHLRVP